MAGKASKKSAKVAKESPQRGRCEGGQTAQGGRQVISPQAHRSAAHYAFRFGGDQARPWHCPLGRDGDGYLETIES